MNFEVKALLVDMDGTLMDTEFAGAQAYAQVISDNGFTLQAEDIVHTIIGRRWAEFLPDIYPNQSDQTYQNIIDAKRKIYPDYYAQIVLNHLLISLIRKTRGLFKTALVTSSSEFTVHSLLNHFQLTDLFDLIITADHVHQHKPHPLPYQQAAKQLGVQAEECLIFEDSTAGIEAAKAFNAQVLVVNKFSLI